MTEPQFAARTRLRLGGLKVPAAAVAIRPAGMGLPGAIDRYADFGTDADKQGDGFLGERERR